MKRRQRGKGLLAGPGPGFEIGAPGDADGAVGVGVGVGLFLAGAHAVEDNDVATHAGDIAKVGGETGGQAGFGPRPAGLTEDEWRAVGAPVEEVGGAFDADAIGRGVEEDVFVVFDEDAGVFTFGDVGGAGRPGGEVEGLGGVHVAVLLVEAPPFAGDVFVTEEEGIDHLPHGGFGDIGAFHADEFGGGPRVEITATHGKETGAGVGEAKFIAATEVGDGVGLEAEKPFVADADDVAGTGVVEVLILGCEDAGGGPVREISGFTDSDIPIDQVIFFFADVGVVELEGAIVADQHGIAEGGVSVALEEDGRREGFEQGRGDGRLARGGVVARRGGCGRGGRQK